MFQFFLLPFLPPGEEDFPSLFAHQNSTGFRLFKVLSRKAPGVHQGKDEPVGSQGPEFLHQVQRQGSSPGPVPMEKSHTGIQSHCFQSMGTVGSQQGVGKGEQRIHGIQRRPFVPFPEEKGLFVPQDQLVKQGKVHMGGIPFHTSQLVPRLWPAADHEVPLSGSGWLP